VHTLSAANTAGFTVAGDPVKDVFIKFDYIPTVTDITGAGIEVCPVFRYIDQNNYYFGRVYVSSADTYQLQIWRVKDGVFTGISPDSPVVSGLPHVAGQAVTIAAAMEGRTMMLKVWRASDAEPYTWQQVESDKDDENALDAPGQWGIRSGIELGNTNAKPFSFNYDNVDVRIIRLTGEMASLTPSWDESHKIKTSRMTVRGVLQRLSQGDAPIRSPMRRAYDSIGTPGSTLLPPVAYWPCEDGARSSSVASGLADGQPLLFNAGVSPDFASNSDFLCSDSLLQLNNSDLTGEIPTYTNTGKIMLRFLISIPASGTVDQDVIARIFLNTGSFWFIDLMYRTGGSLSFQAYDYGNVQLHNEGAFAHGLNGKFFRVQLAFTQTGADIGWELSSLEVGQTVGGTNGGTWTNRTLGAAIRLVLNPYRNIDSVAIGHVGIQKEVSTLFDFLPQLNAYIGETTGRRFLRLCQENGVDAAMWGDPDLGAPMGAQRVDSLVKLLRECADTEQGLLIEARSFSGLILRMRDTLYAQAYTLTLDYANKEVAPDLIPPNDDSGLRNDITAERAFGSSYRSIRGQGEGPKNAGRPWEDPEAVGPYSGRVTVNTQDDGQLMDVADQALRIGTAPDTRYPQVSVNLASGSISRAQLLAVLAVNVGDRIRVVNLNSADIYQPLDQIVHGYSESFADQYSHDITFNTTQYSPWDITVLDQTWLDGDVTLAEDVDTSETSIDVYSNPLLSTDGADYPYDVVPNGERWTVASVTSVGPLFVAAGAVAHAANANVTPTLPAGMSTGDLMVLYACAQELTAIPTAPAGWTTLWDLGCVQIFGRLKQPGDTDPTVTLGGTHSAGCTHSARIFAFRNVLLVPTVMAQTFTGGGQDITVPAIDIPGGQALLVWFGWKADDWTGADPISPEYTEIGDDSSTLGNDQGIVVNYGLVAGGGTVNANLFKITGGAAASTRGVTMAWVNPQTMTVTRGVNGFTKTHANGSAVPMAQQSSYLGR
jgi:hypothetical protein